jgi:hypothetical protein
MMTGVCSILGIVCLTATTVLAEPTPSTIMNLSQASQGPSLIVTMDYIIDRRC